MKACVGEKRRVVEDVPGHRVKYGRVISELVDVKNLLGITEP